MNYRLLIKPILSLGLLLTLALNAASQSLAINNDGSQADASAILDIKSSAKGLLVPRVSSTAAVSSPATGLLVYVTSGTVGFYYNAGTSAVPAWKMLLQSDGNASSLTNIPAANITGTLPAISGVNLTALNAGNLSSGTVPAARMPAMTGDVTAAAGSTATTIANGAVTTNKIADANVTIAKISATGTASSSNFLRGDGSWAVPSSGGGSITNFAVTGTTTYTLTTSNQVVVTTSTAITTFTLPTAATAGVGKTYHLISSANTSGSGYAKAQVSSGSGDLIYQGYANPAATCPATGALGAIILISDGVSKWYAVATL